MNSPKLEVDLDQPNVKEYLTEARLDDTLNFFVVVGFVLCLSGSK